MAHRRPLVHVLLVLSLLVGGLTALPAAAVQPDDTLVFVGASFTDTGMTSRLTTIRADGTGVATLATVTDGGIHAPAWSPDGSQLAYSEFNHGTGDQAVVVIDRTGANRTVLSDTVSTFQLSWSPDGTQVAAGASDGVWVFAADGSSATRIVQTEHFVDGLDWSPDGGRIAYGEDVSASDEFPRRVAIRSVNPDGSDPQSLTDGTTHDRDPQWSPDGSLIAFKRVEGRAIIDLLVMSPTGADQRVISAWEDRGTSDSIGTYEWSPDSGRIVFSSMCDCIGHPDASLFIAEADGTEASVLLAFDEDGFLANVEPTWSPDGETVGFVQLEPHSMGPGSESRGVHLIEADGTNVRAVYDNFDWHGDLSFAPRPDPDDENRVTSDVPESTDGQPVTVTADMPAGTVQVTFSQVTDGGTMTVVQRDPRSAERRPGFSVLDTAFDITVSGVEFGSAEVCVPFDAEEAEAAGLSEEDLGLYHIAADGVRRNVTTSLDTEEGVVCGRVSQFSPFLVGVSRLDRLSGPNRTATAAAIASSAFPAGVPVVYIATQADYPDALAGGPAAAGAEGPILLVRRNAIPAVTAAELQRLGPLSITVLGGTAVVSADVEDQLGTFTDGTVTRISGLDRYETAAAISARHFDAGVDVAFVATGLDFPDALAGGAAAAAEGGPVLLVRTNAIPPATATELERLGASEIVLLGGTAAVSESVRQQLAAYTDGEVTRVFGQNRYDTAAAVMARFDAPADTVYVATGADFPDALVAVPAAGLTGSPLALVRPTSVPPGVLDQLNRLEPDHLFVLGGFGAISADVEPALANTLR